MHSTWKQEGNRSSFAPTTKANFHIVPKDYQGGFFKTDEASCRECHKHVGMPFDQIRFETGAYGEIWGEDDIFTWHPFEISRDAFNTSHLTRRLNPRLISTGLISYGRPAQSDTHYNILDKPYEPIYHL